MNRLSLLVDCTHHCYNSCLFVQLMEDIACGHHGYLVTQTVAEGFKKEPASVITLLQRLVANTALF